MLRVQGDYDIPLSVYYDYVFTAAEQSGAALMQPWELVPFHVPPGEPSPVLTSAHALSDSHPRGYLLARCVHVLVTPAQALNVIGAPHIAPSVAQGRQESAVLCSRHDTG